MWGSGVGFRCGVESLGVRVPGCDFFRGVSRDPFFDDIAVIYESLSSFNRHLCRGGLKWEARVDGAPVVWPRSQASCKGFGTTGDSVALWSTVSFELFLL